MSKAFLSNSGTEAVEAAIKLIRKKYGPDRKIFSLSNAFHGRTYGALTLTANEKYKTPFMPLLPQIYSIEFNNISDLKKISELILLPYLSSLFRERGNKSCFRGIRK